jgi:hypothetical protein
MVEVGHWGNTTLVELVSRSRDVRGGTRGCGPFLWLVGQLFAKTFEALQPLTALSHPQTGRIAVISQNIATQLQLFLRGYTHKRCKNKLFKCI